MKTGRQIRAEIEAINSRLSNARKHSAFHHDKIKELEDEKRTLLNTEYQEL